MEAAMQRVKGALGARCRQQLTTPGLQHPMPVHRSCVAYAGRDRDRVGPSRNKGHGHGALSSAWLLPTSLISERRTKDASSALHPDTPLTVYTIRFTTGVSRDAALSDPCSAVNVCLISRDGRAALHRVSPVNDALESRAHTLEMCQLIGPDAGADCSMALADAAAATGNPQQQPPQPPQQQQPPSGAAGAASSSTYGSSYGSGGSTNLVGRPPPPPPPKRRFLEGSIDEVSILLPELGPLAAVLVGVESGTWYLDEMDVASSRTRHMDRFVCRRQLGGQIGEGAALLTPVPLGAVVYGEGEAAVILSKEQATALWSINMSDYSDLKRRVTATTALLVASGASLAALTGGTAAALPYTAGGVVGLVYQWMLMRGVDQVMEVATGRQQHHQHHHQQHRQNHHQQQHHHQHHHHHHQQQEGMVGGGPDTDNTDASDEPAAAKGPFGGGAGTGSTYSSTYSSRVFGSTPVRLSFVCASAALGMALLSREEAGGVDEVAGAGYSAAAAWQLALGALGFLTYKAALVGVSLGEVGSNTGGIRLGGKVLYSSGGSGSQTELEKFKRD